MLFRSGVAMGVILNICSAPVFTVLLGRVFLTEHATWRQLVAMLGAITGVVLVVMANNAKTPVLNIGAVYAVSAGLCYSSMAVASRRIAAAYAPATTLTAMFGIAALVLVGCALVVQPPLVLPPTAWYGVFYLALIPTALSYMLYVRGLQQASATTATTLTLLEPLTSTVCAVVLLAEPMAGWAWWGLGLAVVSLWAYARPGASTPAASA